MGVYGISEAMRESAAGCWAVIGNFDGVHKGHVHLLQAAARAAAPQPLIALVFRPHPLLFFNPESEPFLLTGDEEKATLLMEAGAGAVIMLPFTQQLASLTPACFVRDILQAELGLRGVATGSDFCFGKQRKGDAQTMADLCRQAGLGYSCIGVLEEKTGGIKYASSTVRKALSAGDLPHVRKLLGRPWVLTGVVMRGDGRGHSIGYPTANLATGKLLLPENGVYAGTVDIDSHPRLFVANCGNRPTFNGLTRRFEIHIPGFSGDLYHKHLQVTVLLRLRGERAFAGIDELRAQISHDIDKAREFLSKEGQ